MLHNKDKVLDTLKDFKVEVEKQYGKQINVIKTYRGGEYYGRYNEDRQALGTFVKLLQDHRIVDQYTILSSSDQNGVADRRNKTLLNMVRSMLSSSKLPKLLWTEALKTTAYLLNQVPTKAITNIPFE